MCESSIRVNTVNSGELDRTMSTDQTFLYKYLWMGQAICTEGAEMYPATRRFSGSEIFFPFLWNVLGVTIM